jgi:hypothetical protein
MNYKS